METRYYSPEDNVLAGLVLEDSRYLSKEPRLHLALLKELREGGFSEDFLWERFPVLRAYLRGAKKPQRLASVNKAL